MSTAIEPHEAQHPAAHTAGHHSDLYYVKIALSLALITGLEVALTYAHVGVLFLPVLLILMAIKFVMVVLFFMHLRFDHKLFSFLFWSGLGLAVGVYAAALATMHFFLS